MEVFLSALRMREEEQSAFSAGETEETLAQKASKSVCSSLIHSGFNLNNILFVCGPGKNGKDGLIAASIMKNIGYNVSVFLTDPDKTDITDRSFEDGGPSYSNITYIKRLDNIRCTVVVDAIFGTGFSRDIDAGYVEIIDWINYGHDNDEFKVMSVDIPSGVYSDSGKVSYKCIKADVTITFGAKKPGHVMYPGCEKCGKVVLDDIGLVISAKDGDITGYTPEDLKKIPSRKERSNKGTYGRGVVVAGSKGMCGAAYLSAKSMYRTGAGYVNIVTCESNRIPLQTMIPEAVLTVYDDEDPDTDVIKTAVERADACVIGPGIGRNDVSVCVLNAALSALDSPCVIDADALNLISEGKALLIRDQKTVITPHPGEMSRLTGKDLEEITDDILRCTVEFANRNNVICLLKDARTAVSDGSRTMINLSGSDSLAKAGSGDVLSGIIGGLMCQGSDPFDAASLGAYIHGLAGESAEKKFGKYSVLASETSDCIADVLKSI